MGACMSWCSNLFHPYHSPDRSQEQPLLYDNPFHPQYGGVGTFPPGPSHPLVSEPDPEELKRERDALERLCAQTFDKLIDVSQPPSSNSTSSSKFTAEYSRLFAEAFPAAAPSSSPSHTSNENPSREEDQQWLKRIMEQDPNSRVWDWRVVRKIDGELTFDFDGFLQREE